MFSDDVLKRKRILVTGGGTGLGREMSVGFAAHGAHVFICGRRPDILDHAVGEIRSRSGGAADAMVANVRDPDSIEKMLAAIWATGLLTGLVNNAGRQVGLIDACGSWPPRATDHGHLASWHEVVN